MVVWYSPDIPGKAGQGMDDPSDRRRSAKQIVGGPTRTVGRHVARAVAPRSIKNAAAAEWRGTRKSLEWLYGYWNAYDKLDLRIKNPKLHHDICLERRKIVLGWICFFALFSCIVYAWKGPVWTTIEAFVVLTGLMIAGREDKAILVEETKYRIGLGETDVRRAIARAVMGWDLTLEKNKEKWREIIVRHPFMESPGGETMTMRIGLPSPHSAVKARVRRAEIAAALDLSADQVRIVVDSLKKNEGDFDLIIYSQDPWAIPPTKAPYVLHASVQDIWDGFEFANDIDRKPVLLELIGKSALIGGLPEMGKTTTALTILAGCVQDPYVRLWIADAKGVDTPDLIPVAFRYVGSSQDQILDMCDELEVWGRRKLASLKELRKVKLDRETCNFYRALDPNHPLSVIDVVYIDEARFFTKNANTAMNTKIVERLSQIVEMFRAVGIIVIVATQRPSAEVIPTILRDLLRVRIAHACTTPSMSNTILGEGAAGAGYSAASFDEDDKGVAWMRVLKIYRNIRPHYTEPNDFSNVCQFGYAIREKTGTLPEQVDAALAKHAPRLLLAVEKIMTVNEWTKIPSLVLLEKLHSVDGFGGMDAKELSAKMSNYNISPNPIGEWTFEDGTFSSNVRGYRLSAIQTAIAKAVKEFSEA